jgi:hypothetical protein
MLFSLAVQFCLSTPHIVAYFSEKAADEASAAARGARLPPTVCSLRANNSLNRIVSCQIAPAAKMAAVPVNLYSLVECLTQRRRETESAEKSQKSERKERYDKKRPENFFHPIGENNYDTN